MSRLGHRDAQTFAGYQTNAKSLHFNGFYFSDFSFILKSYGFMT